MVPVVFGTARLVVTVLLGLVPSWRSLLPSANQRGRTERVTGWAAQGPCTQTLEAEFIELFIYSFFSAPLLCAVCQALWQGLGIQQRKIIEDLSRSLI